MSREPIHVLLIEDEPSHAHLVKRYLESATEREFVLEWVDRLEAGLKRLAEKPIDVVLLDLGLPDSEASSTLRRVLGATDTPVVVLTTSEDPEEAIAAVKAGAQDHLPKPRISADLLTRSLVYAIERKQTERQLKQFNETLERRVAERSALAEDRARKLRRLALELSQAELREKRRLARLLHDDLQQLIAAARMRVQMVARNVVSGPEKESLEGISELLGQIIDVSRSLTLDLSPPVLHEQGLGLALEWLGRRMHDQHRLRVTVTVVGDPRCFSDDTAPLMLDAVRELLFNIVKHAGVDRAEVTLDCADDAHGKLTIVDHGTGFDTAAEQERDQMSAGFGLFSIRERIEAIGGTFEIESLPGTGTTITLTAPYAPD